MRESYQPGDTVLVYDTPGNRARAESGEEIPGRPATVEENVTPHASLWDPWAPVPGGRPGQYGAYVNAGPGGPATYRVVFADGTTAHVSVHQLMPPAEIAAALEEQAQASEWAAAYGHALAAEHSAEAGRLHAAAHAVHPAVGDE